MTLFGLKWLAAIVIMLITLLTGFLSVGFARRFHKQLEIGDAIANGIFIGAALFHLLPEAIIGFKHLSFSLVYLRTALLLITSYFIFWAIEKLLLHQGKTAKKQVHVGILILILSIHAFIAGLALGISEELTLVSILFIAIVAHKGFETFAFTINVYRQIGNRFQLYLLLILFSLITPAGILLGLFSDSILHTHTDNILTATFSAIAAGTFLFIGTTHSHHLRHQPDSYRQYTRVVATTLGVLVMGVIAFWI